MYARERLSPLQRERARELLLGGGGSVEGFRKKAPVCFLPSCSSSLFLASLSRERASQQASGENGLEGPGFTGEMLNLLDRDTRGRSTLPSPSYRYDAPPPPPYTYIYIYTDASRLRFRAAEREREDCTLSVFLCAVFSRQIIRFVFCSAREFKLIKNFRVCSHVLILHIYTYVLGYK